MTVLLSVSFSLSNVSAVSVPVPPTDGALTWEEYEWGDLTSTVLAEGVEVSGSYDGTDTTPYTGGFNNYFLLSNEVFTDDVMFSVDITVPEFMGTEAIVGIGIRAPSEMDFCYRDSILWCWYYYSAAGSDTVGWLHECLNNVYERTTVDDTNIVLGQTYNYMISVDRGMLSFYIDGECLASESNPLSEFNIFMEVAVKYDGTSIDAVFENLVFAQTFYPQMEPIYIDGNEDFTRENGIVGGTGTPDDPFIIDGWTFHDYYIAVMISNTDAHFVLRNITASGGLGGIYMYQVSNGSIEGAVLSDNLHAGTYLNTVKNCTVADSNIHDNGHEGVIFRYSEGIVVSGNTLERNAWEGLMIEYSEDITISDNVIVGNGFSPDPSVIEYLGYGGIYLVSVSGCAISENWISENVEGVCAFSSDHLTIVSNYGISENAVGVALEDCILSRVYWNNLLNNGLQAEDKWAVDFGRKSANRWDNGPEGGNFWSDYVGPGGRYVFEDNVDRHPLSAPLEVL